MYVRRRVRDEDFVSLHDEELVGLVRLFDWLAPLEELLKRLDKYTWSIMPEFVKSGPWSNELNDLKQVGLIAGIEAIAGYDLAELHKSKPCHFQSFFIMVAKERMIDFYRIRQRYERRREPAAHWDKELDERALHDGEPGTWFLLFEKEQTDPALVAQQHEFRDRYCELIGSLGGLQAFFWEEWRAGTPVTESAGKAGVSESKAWRIRYELIAKFYLGLRNVGPE